MFPDNFFADLAGNLFTMVWNAILAFLLVPLTSLTDALSTLLTDAFTPGG